MTPFLDVISSQSTTGVITSLALASIGKFFSFGIISRESENIGVGLSQLAVAITHCRFEATDQSEDDGVLLRILYLMEVIVCGECGELLSDDSVCEIVETCLSMACQMRRGDVLRRSAEMTMIKLSQSVFGRLHDIEPDEENDPPVEDLNKDNVKMTEDKTSPGYEEIGSKILVSGGVDRRHSEIDADEKNEETEVEVVANDGVGEGVSSAPPTPYGIFSIREVFRVLVSILDPSNFHQYTDSTRIMALRLLNVAFEISGSQISKHPSLLNLTTTTLCKHLFQLVKYDNPILLQSTLRLTLTLFHTTGKYFKLQQEFLLTYLLTCLSPLNDIPREFGVDSVFYDGVPNRPKLVKVPVSYPGSKSSTPVGNQTSNDNSASANASNGATPNGRSTPNVNNYHALLNIKTPEIREIMIEAITNMTRSDSFFSDLFVNYDCTVDRTDLCEDLIGFLCRNAYPDSATWSTASVPPLCLEAILALVSSINGRIMNTSHITALSDDDYKLADQVMETKARKKMVISATDSFNINAKTGIKQLIDEKLIENDDPKSLALFLKESGRLNKSTLGEYLSKPVNKKVMEHFIEDFDFSDKRIDEALREFLCCFRLPGESQQIEQIFEKFASQYCNGANNINEVNNEDAAFVLSYAVIMLNTDLHSKQIKVHMTLDQFKRNLRGANNNKDFSPQYLEEIYNTIKSREIIMPDEHDNDETFDFAWKNLLLKTSQAGNLSINNNIIYDKHMFEVCWKPIVTTLSFIFATATDDTVFLRVITGFNQIAQIANYYKLPDIIDNIILCLSKISTLSFGDLSAPTNSKTEVLIEKDKIMVSDLSIPFGRDFKCQMATVTLFKIVRSCVGSIREGWNLLLPSFVNLYLYDLISPTIDNDLNTNYSLAELPRIAPKYSFKRGKGGRDVGLLSTLSSYLTGYNDSSPEPTDEEVDATLCTIDCINSCEIYEIFNKIRSLEDDSLNKFIQSINNILPNIIDSEQHIKQLYYPTCLFLLEFLVSLTISGSSKNISKVAAAKFLDYFTIYIEKWEVLNEEFLSRIFTYALLIIAGTDNEIITEDKVELILKSSHNINISILTPLSVKIIKPLIKLSSWNKKKLLTNDDYWNLINITLTDAHCRQEVFIFIKDIIDNSPENINEENFNNFLLILGKIADEVQPAEQQQQFSSLDTLYKMNFIVLETYEKTPNTDNWKQLFYQYIESIGKQCVNKNRNLRTQALNYYQRTLLSEELHSRQGFDWITTFDRAIFPLISTLLKPEVYQIDPNGMGSTRLQGASLLCKIFLQYVIQVQQHSKDVLSLWIRILDTLDRLVNSGQKDSLKESVIESLKNVILVVSSSEFGADEEFWDQTWKRIDGFLPGLKKEVFPETTTPIPSPPSSPLN